MENQNTAHWGKEWAYVEEKLVGSGFDSFGGGEIHEYPFRSRFQHTRRVYMWMKRIREDFLEIDKEALELATIFHDVGYSKGMNKEHAIHSAEIFREYAKAEKEKPDAKEIYHNEERVETVARLIEAHSEKRLLKEEGIPKELILLQEADLLDEEGAMRIAWDGMAEGICGATSFESCYDHHKKFWNPDYNPMVTPKAKEFFAKKQQLMAQYLDQLLYDLQKENYE